MQISPGKYRGLQRLSDDAGLFKMVAVDQRNPIFGPIKRIRGTAEAPYADVAAVKDLLTRALAPKSSAITFGSDLLLSASTTLRRAAAGPYSYL